MLGAVVVELERITTVKTRGPVRAVVPAPEGRWLLVVRGAPIAVRNGVEGAALYQRTDAGFALVGELPGADTMFALDDGGVIEVHADYREVELIRYGPDGGREASFIALTGLSLQDVRCVLDG